MSYITRFSAVFAVMLVLTMGQQMAYACRPGPDAPIMRPDAQNFVDFPLVFIGKVTSEERSAKQVTGAIQVLKIYKGESSKTIRYLSATHSCGWHHGKGAIVLLFVTEPEDGVLALGALTPGRWFETEAEAIKYADEAFSKTRK